MAASASSSNSKYDYDFLVIGGGSGGVRSSRIAAGHGARVALVELSQKHGPPTYTAIGGTCVNVGCVPKKLYVLASRFHNAFSDAAAVGWKGSQTDAFMAWKELVDKKNAEITRLNGAYEKILKNAGSNGGVVTIEGFAKFVDPHTVEITPPAVAGAKQEPPKRVTAEVICVATGGWPYKPSNVKGIEHAITSNEVFYLEELPKRLLIVGGGYIAVEFAAMFNLFGSKVTLMYRGPMFLRGFDGSCREHLANQLKDAGVDIQFNSNPAQIEKTATGYKVTTETGAQAEYDCVVYATGRVPKTEGIGLDKAGVKLGSKGEITVNQHGQTNVEHIFAVGDVTDKIQLTPVALREGHYLADNLFANPRTPGLRGASALKSQETWKIVDYEYVASTVFTTPELGTVGYTEEQAVEKFKNITVYQTTFKPMLQTITGGKLRTYMKLIVDDATDRVVGCHMVGDNAGETIQGIGIALKCGATKAKFDETIGIHPTSAEEFVTMRTPSYKFKDGKKV